MCLYIPKCYVSLFSLQVPRLIFYSLALAQTDISCIFWAQYVKPSADYIPCGGEWSMLMLIPKTQDSFSLPEFSTLTLFH